VIGEGADAHDLIPEFLREAGYRVSGFESVARFLASDLYDSGACVLADILDVEADQFALLDRLAATGASLPTIVIANESDSNRAAEAVEAGAVDFLLRPLRRESVIARTKKAIIGAERERDKLSASHDAADKLRRLTVREAEIFGLLIEGQSN